MFEMLSPRATIVVVPERDSIVLHGARDMDTLEELHPQPFAEEYGWPVARAFDQLRSIEDVIKASETLNPMKEEGFVLCDGKSLLRYSFSKF